MLFSKSAKQLGGNGLFFDDDKNAPVDVISVSDSDVKIAINLPIGETFDFDVNGQLLLTPARVPSSAEIKMTVLAAKMQAIKVARDRRQLDGGVKVGNHWFLSNERAVSEYNTIVATTSGIPATTVVRKDWRTMDGATVDMTPVLALQILKTGIQQRYVIDDAALAHKAAIEACADPESYDYSTGWPDIYTPEVM